VNGVAIDKKAARAAFNRAASSYDAVAALQLEIGSRLLERLDIIKMIPTSILDVGCGTGAVTQKLAQRYRHATIYALDFASHMLSVANDKKTWRQKYWQRTLQLVCGDAERLPIQNESIDFIFSNLTLQWCNQLDQTFAEFRRVLKPGGLVMFSTLGPDTLKELRSSWQRVDTNHHVHTFIDMHDIGDTMVRAGLADPVMDMENITVTYRDIRKLMRELKQLGAHNASSLRPQQLTGKSHFKQMLANYEQFRQDSVYPASYEAVYGHAWAPINPKVTKSTTTSVNVSFQKTRSGK